MALTNDLPQVFESALLAATGKNVQIKDMLYLAGGYFNNAIKLDTSEGTFFLKWNTNQAKEVFEAEAKGLRLLKEHALLHVPAVVGSGHVSGTSYLLLEFVPSRFESSAYWQDFGRAMAKLHRQTAPGFGLHFQNFTGGLPQKNTPANSWADFFFANRLKPQFGRAFYHKKLEKHYLRSIEKLHLKLPELLPQEPPALLHGDFWSGNAMPDRFGNACIFDPAVYYGHREMDLATARLLGGFPPAFFESYHHEYPLEPGFEERASIYQLYPLVVHVNLFGSS